MATENRLRHYLDFCDFGYPILDIGDRGVVTVELEKALGKPIRSTERTDFNYEVSGGRSDTVLCFEVLEHVMNPLRFLTQVRGLTERVLYLSTPVSRYGVYCTSNHFTEYKRPQLETLIRYAGFDILRRTEFRLIPYPTGIRPFFRMFIHRIQLYELSPTRNRGTHHSVAR